MLHDIEKALFNFVETFIFMANAEIKHGGPFICFVISFVFNFQELPGIIGVPTSGAIRKHVHMYSIL